MSVVVRPVDFEGEALFHLEDEIRKMREEEDEKLMEKYAQNCQSCGEAAMGRGGKVPGGRSKMAGGGAAGSRGAGGKEEGGGKGKIEART